MRPRPELFPLFAATWVALGFAAFWFLVVGKNIARKKRLLPVFNVGTGALFVVFTLLIMGDLRVMAFVAPATVLIVFLNQRILRVCDSCGRVIQSWMPFYRVKFCSGCGAKIP